jgi:hypothetical protein
MDDAIHRLLLGPSLVEDDAHPAEINLMAEQYLQAGHWRELEALALAKIMSSPTLRPEYERAGAKYEAAMARRRD